MPTHIVRLIFHELNIILNFFYEEDKMVWFKFSHKYGHVSSTGTINLSHSKRDFSEEIGFGNKVPDLSRYRHIS